MTAAVTLWGRTSSINVRKVMLALNESGVPHRRIDAGRQFGVVDTPAFVALNPNAMVPLLQDGDVTLWESNVVVRYLCSMSSDSGLFPRTRPPAGRPSSG